MSSRKVYLSNGGQQDAEEFLRVLIEQLMFELPAGNTFVSVLQSFWGTEKTIRKFLGTPDGKCPRCKTYPGSTDEPFFTIKIKVPDFNCRLNLSSLVDRYYTENNDRMDMKCSYCCPHPSNCPLTGICRQRPAVSQTVMTRSPKYLIVQLQRFTAHNSPKIQTVVVPEERLTLTNFKKYDLLSSLDHLGNSCHSGHYVSNINTDGYWILCNDANLSNVDENSAKSKDNYLYVYKKFTETVSGIYPKLVPTPNWQEIQPWQSVPHGCEMNMNIKTGRQFVRLNPVTGSTSSQDAKHYEKRHQNKRQFPETMNVQTKRSVASQPQNSQSQDSELTKKQKVNQKNSTATNGNSEVKKKSQVGSYKEELQECENCKRNFADLVKHKESKTCVGEGTGKNVLEETLNEAKYICKGCKKEYQRLITHLNSKSGSKCKELYNMDEVIIENKAKILEKKRKHYEKN